MTIPKLSVQSLDTVQHQRRVAESINNIVNFEFDDSRQRTAAEKVAGVLPANPAYIAEPPDTVRRYGFVGDGASTMDVEAINKALSVCPIGGTVLVHVTEKGIAVGENTITVPAGRRLVVSGRCGLPLNRFVHSGSLGIGDVPGMGMFIVTSTTLPPIVLHSNATIEGAMFWYPNQNWDISSLSESFTSYPAAVQLGDATDPGPSHPIVSRCQFLGATRCISQYAADGTSLRGGTFEYLTGVLLGEGLRVARSTDVLHCQFWHFTPNTVTNYVGDSSVGGDVHVFRAKCAQAAKAFHLGGVDDVRAMDCFAFGVLNYVHWNNGFYTGDAGEGLGGTFIGCAADSCYQAFAVDRSVSTLPVNIVGGWFAPNFRPTGDVSDASSQALVYYASGITDTRVNIVAVAVSGGEVGEYPTDYSGMRDHDFASAGAIGTGNNIMVSDFQTRNRGDVSVTAAMQSAVSLMNWSDEDVAQAPVAQNGYDTLAGGYYFGGVKVIGTRSTGWDDAMTGTESRAAFDTSTVTTEQLAQRVAALINDLRSDHGLIGS